MMHVEEKLLTASYISPVDLCNLVASPICSCRKSVKYLLGVSLVQGTKEKELRLT